MHALFLFSLTGLEVGDPMQLEIQLWPVYSILAVNCNCNCDFILLDFLIFFL